MPVESSKGCNTALKSCCSVLVHSAHIDTEPPIFFDVDATADPLDATIDRPAVVVNAPADIRILRDPFTRLNSRIFRSPLMVDEAGPFGPTSGPNRPLLFTQGPLRS